MDILISGEPNISQIIHHNQEGQQYLRNDGTLWRVTNVEVSGVDESIVNIHTVNGWERLIQEQVTMSQFEKQFKPYAPKPVGKGE